MSVLFGLLDLGPTEMIIVGVLAVLLFGDRLPEVGRSFGKKFMEFRNSMRGIEEEIASITRGVSSSISAPPSSSSSSSHASTSSPARTDVNDYAEATAPKFEPPPAEAKSESPGT